MNIKYVANIYLLVLFLGAVLPLNSGSSLNDHYTLHIRWDYLLHAMVYMPLPVLLGLYLRKGSPEKMQQQVSAGRFRIPVTRFWIPVVLISLLITSLFELVQLVIPYRAFNINDLVANGVGAIIGFGVILIFRRTIFLA